jgi:protein O-GlcNAc transferase
VRRNPDSLEAHLLLADLARTSTDEATARAEYQKAAALAPENAEVQLLLIQFVAPRDEAAAFEFTRLAVEKLPAHPGLNVEMGRLWLKRGSAQEAAERFRRALEAEPGLAAAHAGRADALAAMGDLAGAIAEMERAAGQDPDGSWHYRLGGWYRTQGRAEEARAAFAETARIKSAVRARQEENFRKLTQAPGVAAR